MMKKQRNSCKSIAGIAKNSGALILALLLAIGVSTSALAQEKGTLRQGGLDIFLLGQQMLGDSTKDKKFSLDLDVEDTFVVGAGLGVNLNDNINLNFDAWTGGTDIKLRGLGKADSDLVGVDVNLDYNILRTEVTPVITGGIGFIRFSGSLDDRSFDETDFSYNLGGGVRWDLSRNFFLKGLYRFTWTKLDDTQNRILFDGFSFSVGYVFR